MAARPRLDAAERRRRLLARHHLGGTAGDVDTVARDLVALHSSDPATPVLACWARVSGFTAEDLARALYDDRTLWRLHSVRRTLFVVPADEGAVHVRATGEALAVKERRRVVGWLEAAGTVDDPASWLDGLAAEALAHMGDGVQRTTRELADEVPALATEVPVAQGKMRTTVKLSSRVLYELAMRGAIVRGRPGGTWRASQYPWTATRTWFGRDVDEIEPGVARARLLERYVARFGPVTETDLRWWTGWTVASVRAAVAAAGLVEVDLDGSEVGWVVAGDEAPMAERAAERTVALLPGLDPTPMGWKQRAWYLGDHEQGPLFDRNGNIGPTVWVDGRVVGGWGQRPDGTVVTRLLDEVGAPERRRVDDEAARLTAWLDGTVVTPRFRTPLERELGS